MKRSSKPSMLFAKYIRKISKVGRLESHF